MYALRGVSARVLLASITVIKLLKRKPVREKRVNDAKDDGENWESIPRWAYWLALFAIAGLAFAIINLV